MVLDYGFEGNVDNGLQAFEFLGASGLFGWRKYGDLRMFGRREGMFCWKAEFFDICRFLQLVRDHTTEHFYFTQRHKSHKA